MLRDSESEHTVARKELLLGLSASVYDHLNELYNGNSLRGRRLRYGLIVFDIATISVFLVSSVAREEWWMKPLDLLFAVLIGADLIARLVVEPDKRGYLLSLATVADVVVIVSLIFSAVIDNLGFLRVARSLRMLRS